MKSYMSDFNFDNLETNTLNSDIYEEDEFEENPNTSLEDTIKFYFSEETQTIPFFEINEKNLIIF